MRSIRHTPAVVSGAIRRCDVFVVSLTSTLGYLLIYLWMIGDLSIRSGTGIGLFIVDHPFRRMFEQAPGAFSYEPILLLRFGAGTYLFSPINASLALSIAILVGLNIALSYLAIMQPKSCGLGVGTGIFASIPALVAGSACCAPILLVVFGITATGTILTVLSWLLPIGLLLLIASLVYLAGQIHLDVLVS
jgi:hypothetical protein